MTTIHVKRQKVGAIVWASRVASNPIVVGEPAWVLPGEDYYGIPYQRLVAAAARSGDIELELPDDELPVLCMVRRSGQQLTDLPK